MWPERTLTVDTSQPLLYGVVFSPDPGDTDPLYDVGTTPRERQYRDDMAALARERRERDVRPLQRDAPE